MNLKKTRLLRFTSEVLWYVVLHFVVVVGLERPRDSKSYAGGSVLLVGSPLPAGQVEGDGPD
jgi:hypothetical protein